VTDITYGSVSSDFTGTGFSVVVVVEGVVVVVAVVVVAVVVVAVVNSGSK
jgi:hypothetical protein